MKNNLSVSLVIPCLDEEVSIVETIKRARQVFDTMNLSNYEIILVDDGSTDRSAELALSEGAEVVQHPHTAGYGKAIKDGIYKAKHDTIVTSDADGTYPLSICQLGCHRVWEHVLHTSRSSCTLKSFLC